MIQPYKLVLQNHNQRILPNNKNTHYLKTSNSSKKWRPHISGRENKDIIKLLTFHTANNKKFGRKLPTVPENAIRV